MFIVCVLPAVTAAELPGFAALKYALFEYYMRSFSQHSFSTLICTKHNIILLNLAAAKGALHQNKCAQSTLILISKPRDIWIQIPPRWESREKLLPANTDGQVENAVISALQVCNCGILPHRGQQLQSAWIHDSYIIFSWWIVFQLEKSRTLLDIFFQKSDKIYVQLRNKDCCALSLHVTSPSTNETRIALQC